MRWRHEATAGLSPSRATWGSRVSPVRGLGTGAKMGEDGDVLVGGGGDGEVLGVAAVDEELGGAAYARRPCLVSRRAHLFAERGCDLPFQACLLELRLNQ